MPLSSDSASDAALDDVPLGEVPAGFVPPPFDEVYETHVDYLWRSARGLGVPEANVDDVLQDVFVKIH